MSRSSARPEELRGYATALTAAASSARPEVDRVAPALAAYRAGCPHAPPLHAALHALAGTLVRAGTLGARVDLVAQAFTLADDEQRLGLAVTSDRHLSDVVAGWFPALGAGALLEPIREQEARGRDAARRLLRRMDHASERQLSDLLVDLHASDVRDPVFAAAFMNELGRDVDGFFAVTERLAYAGGTRQHPSAAMQRLSELHNVASRTWDRPGPAGAALSRGLVATLLRTDEGRVTLRALVGTSPVAAGDAYLVHLTRPLLFDHPDTGTAPVWTQHYVAAEADGDGAFLAAVGRSDAASAHLLTAEIDGHPVEDRVDDLFHLASFDAQDEIGAVLGRAFTSGPLATMDQRIVRWQHMDRAVAQAARDPDAVREPFAQFLAGSICDDLPYWSGRAMSAHDPATIGALEAVVAHATPRRTALLYLGEAERTFLGESLAAGAPTQDLTNLGYLWEDLHEAAVAADVPEDDSSWIVAGAETLAGMVTVKGGPVGQVAYSVASKAAVRVLEDRLRPDEDRPATEATIDERTRARANTWLAVAGRPELAHRLAWQPAGRTGGAITGPDDLAQVWRPELRAAFTAWMDLQADHDPELARLVQQQVDELERTSNLTGGGDRTAG